MTEQRFIMIITETEIQAYARISGDDNPIHVDNDAALAAGLSTPCAHGMLVTGKLLAQLCERNLLSTAPRRTNFSYLAPIPANEQFVVCVEEDACSLKIKISTKAETAIKGVIAL